MAEDNCYGRLFDSDAISCRSCIHAEDCQRLSEGGSVNYTSRRYGSGNSSSRRAPSDSSYRYTAPSTARPLSKERATTLPGPMPRTTGPSEGENKWRRLAKNTTLSVAEMSLAQMYLFICDMDWE